MSFNNARSDMNKYLSKIDFLVICVTAILFVVALFVKGFTHDLLLEAGVLLVSIKLILMNYKNNRTNEVIIKELKEIKEKIKNSKE